MGIVQNTEKYYKKLNQSNGLGSPQNLWVTQDRQVNRFKKTVQIMNFKAASILDVGCGYGDFYQYMIENGINTKSYTGIDLLPEHCNIAKKNLPNTCKIITGDFLKTELEKYDYCVLSGTLNYYDKGWFSFAHEIIDKMWTLAKKGIIFNIRSPESMDARSPDNARQIKDLSPSYWSSYAHSMTKRYALYHDYVDYDYTIAMWKNLSSE